MTVSDRSCHLGLRDVVPLHSQTKLGQNKTPYFVLKNLFIAACLKVFSIEIEHKGTCVFERDVVSVSNHLRTRTSDA